MSGAKMEWTAVEEPASGFHDSSQSVDDLLAAAAPKKGTSMRLFAFKPIDSTERLALVFVGPEAVKLSEAFVQIADDLFNAIEASQEGA